MVGPGKVGMQAEGAVTRSAARATGRGRSVNPASSRRRARGSTSASSDDDSSDEEPKVTDAGGNGVPTGDPKTYLPKKFHGSFSSKRVGQLISKLNEEKKEIVRSIGLGGLLEMRPKMHHSRHLIFWLVKHLDVQQMRLCIPGRPKIALTDQSVERILGIRSAGIPLTDGGRVLNKEVRTQLSKAFRTEDTTVLPTVEDAKKVLVRRYKNRMTDAQRGTFAMAMAAYCCAHMLGPEDRSAKVPNGVWHFISDPGLLRHCNWAAYVLSVIKRNALQIQSNLFLHPKSIRLGGCWLYLEILYLDTVDLGLYNVPLDVSPRVSAYKEYNVTELISMDEVTRSSFGSRPQRIVNADDGRSRVGGDAAGCDGNGAQTERGETSRNERRASDQDEESIRVVKEQLATILRSLGAACENVQRENEILFRSQQSRIESMFSGLQNSVKEQVENILYYMKKANEGEQNMARDEVPQGAENGKGYAEASCCNEKGNRSAAGNEDQVNERCGREHDADEGGSRLSSPAQEKAKNKGVDEGTPRPVFDATPYTGQESAPVFDCTPNYSAQPFDAPLMTGIMEGHVLSASAVIAEGSRKHRVKVSATKPRKVCTRRKFGSIGDHGTGSKGGDEAGPDDERLVKRKRSSISEKGDLHVEIAPSPFDLKYELPGRLRQVAYDKYKDIMSKKGTVLQSAWIKLEDPWFMEVTGAQLQASFNDNAAISTVLMSIVVRLIQHEDTAMYIKHGSKHK
ncbi:unnamed protein product [Urochloa humidicola]